MKKLTAILLLLCVTHITLNAQDNGACSLRNPIYGTGWYGSIGTSLTFGNTENQNRTFGNNLVIAETQRFSSTFNPCIGYFFRPKWAVGGGLFLGRDRTTFFDDNADLRFREIESSIGVMGYLRYGAGIGTEIYPANKFGYYVDLGVGYGSTQNYELYDNPAEYELDDERIDNSIGNYFNVGLRAGLNYFVHPNVAVQAQVGNFLTFSRTTDEIYDNNQEDFERKVINSDFTIFDVRKLIPEFGFVYFLNRGK